MEKKLRNPAAEVVITCLSEKYLKNEVMLDDHCFVRIISGEIKITQSDSSRIFQPGDTILLPRRQLSTVAQYPKDDKPYQCVLIMLKTKRLREYYAANPVQKNTAHVPAVKAFDKHPLLESYFASLIPYLEFHEELPEKLVTLKIEEAITILRTIDQGVDAFLSDFSEPGKIDLADFMEQNYMHNMTLDKFSFLTGRSLTTFKRDFSRIYDATPQRWLTEKRLKLAHYLLSANQQKPVEIFREVGFENLSHFSYAFKKQFGYAPKEV